MADAATTVPAFLAFDLLARNGERPSSIGVDLSQPGRDLLRGAGLAAVIGGSGWGRITWPSGPGSA